MDMMMLAEAVKDSNALGVGLGIAGAAIGSGLVVIGGGRGIGMIGASAAEGTARQPEVAGRIFTTMIVAAALIEGFTFFALVLCMIWAGPLTNMAKAMIGQ
jgi:F-type H+-transporting ATPase subunit c